MGAKDLARYVAMIHKLNLTPVAASLGFYWSPGEGAPPGREGLGLKTGNDFVFLPAPRESGGIVRLSLNDAELKSSSTGAVLKWSDGAEFRSPTRRLLEWVSSPSQESFFDLMIGSLGELNRIVHQTTENKSFAQSSWSAVRNFLRDLLDFLAMEPRLWQPVRADVGKMASERQEHARAE